MLQKLKGKVAEKATAPLQYIVDVERRHRQKVAAVRVPAAESEVGFLREILSLQERILREASAGSRDYDYDDSVAGRLASAPAERVEAERQGSAAERAELDAELAHSRLRGDHILTEQLRGSAAKVQQIVEEWSGHLTRKYARTDSGRSVKRIVGCLGSIGARVRKQAETLPRSSSLPPAPPAPLRAKRLAMERDAIAASAAADALDGRAETAVPGAGGPVALSRGAESSKAGAGQVDDPKGPRADATALTGLNPRMVVTRHRVSSNASGDTSKGFTVHVFRDDALVGGTKQRALAELLVGSSEKEFVYAGPVFGFAQIALAHTAKRCGKKATVVLARQPGGKFHPLTQHAKRRGAKVVEVRRPNDLKSVQRRAAEYVRTQNRECPGQTKLLPFGLHCEEFVEGLRRAVAAAMPPLPAPAEEGGRTYECLQAGGRGPERLWLVAGSATLLASFARLWPHTHFLVVQVGKKIWPDQLVRHAPECPKMRGDDGWRLVCSPACAKFRSTLYVAPEPFADRAKSQPPYPSVSNYDAKLWQFVVAHGREGDFVWNVGADRKMLGETESGWETE
jgi:hypothetical protein